MTRTLFPSKAVNTLLAVLAIAIVLAILFLLDRSLPQAVDRTPPMAADAATRAPRMPIVVAGLAQAPAPQVETLPVVTIVGRAPKPEGAAAR